MRLTTLVIASVFAVSACTTITADFRALQEREWKLVWTEAFPSMPSGVANPTLRFGPDGRLGGNTGCNSAGAAYTAEGDRLMIQPMISTKRACVNPAGNQLERAYIEAIEATRRYRIANGELELLDENGRVVARFN